MVTITTCDECGKLETKVISLQTGYIHIEGREHDSQSADLCDEHYPKEGMSQPNNCKKVSFRWPKGR